MKPKAIVVAFALACTTLAGSFPTLAAETPMAPGRQSLVDTVIQKWGDYVAKTYKIRAETWASEMSPALADASLEELQAAASSEDFDSVNRLLLGQNPLVQDTDTAHTKVLGDINSDLVFVPITPCRLFDTRLAGGQIAANTTRAFDVTAVTDYSFQGGAASNCNGAGAAGSFAAAAINFTVVTPAASGYITAFPFLGTQPLAATVNYSAGSIVGNYAVVKLDQGASANELNVYSFAQTHLVADLVGYYVAVPPTALKCQDTAAVPENIVAGSQGNATATVCPATFTQTATNCESSSWLMPIVYSRGGVCSAQNNGASTAVLRASRTCCQLGK